MLQSLTIALAQVKAGFRNFINEIRQIAYCLCQPKKSH